MPNEGEVLRRFIEAAFTLVEASSVNGGELLRRCAGASIVVGVEGAHAAPAFIFLGGGATLGALHLACRVTTMMPRLGPFFGLVTAMFVGEAFQDSTFQFRVDPDELLKWIDEVAKRKERR